MKTATLKTREEISLNVVEEGGITYLNPFIGFSAAETCEKLNDGLGVLHHLLGEGVPGRGMSEEIQVGLALFIQTMWTAAQFESTVYNETKGGAA